MTGNPKAWMVHYRIWESSLQGENTLVFNKCLHSSHINPHKLTVFVICSGLDDARNTAQLAARMMRDGCVMKVTRSLTRVSGRHPVVPPNSWPLSCLAVRAHQPSKSGTIFKVWIFLTWINNFLTVVLLFAFEAMKLWTLRDFKRQYQSVQHQQICAINQICLCPPAGSSGGQTHVWKRSCRQQERNHKPT